MSLFVDISVFNSLNIDWQAYKTWAAQLDGVSRVSMRSSYGTGYVDQHFQTYRAGALAAGIDSIIYYHYAYPQYNTGTAEADWQHSVVGSIRSTDVMMLDYEENVSQATADWAYEWLSRQEANYGGKLPTIYASDSYIRQRLQDNRLARYPLTLANWQFIPTERPPCPPPWQAYTYLQYTDRATNIPGIPGSVDADVYLGTSLIGGPPPVTNQQQSAKDCWESTAPLFGGTAPNYATGIAAAWQALYSEGKKPGPPLTPEYGSVNWNGNAIRVQEFANTRCEWDGQPHWYPQL
jgi:hypothetical protein